VGGGGDGGPVPVCLPSSFGLGEGWLTLFVGEEVVGAREESGGWASTVGIGCTLSPSRSRSSEKWAASAEKTGVEELRELAGSWGSELVCDPCGIEGGGGGTDMEIGSASVSWLIV